MAENEFVNQVYYGDTKIIDLSGSTVTPEKLGLGLKAYNAAGAPIEGTSQLTITKFARGTFTSPGTTIDKISITSIGFKPKIFMLYNNGAVLSGNTSSPYNLVGAISIYGDDYVALDSEQFESHVTYFILKSSSSSQPAQGGHSSGNAFIPIEGGVKGVAHNSAHEPTDNTASVRMASSINYEWFAWA